MSWSRLLLRKCLILLAIAVAAGALSACSGFRPVYGDAYAPVTRHTFTYADPGSRLDQIIYTELRLRLGPASTSPDALRIHVTTYTTAEDLTRTAVTKPATTAELTVTATVTVVDADGETILAGTRRQSALYTTIGQVLADNAARTDAGERAAKTLAETVRLAILGALETAGGA